MDPICWSLLAGWLATSGVAVYLWRQWQVARTAGERGQAELAELAARFAPYAGVDGDLSRARAEVAALAARRETLDAEYEKAVAAAASAIEGLEAEESRRRGQHDEALRQLATEYAARERACQDKLSAEQERLLAVAGQEQSRVARLREELEAGYEAGRRTYEALQQDIRLLEENLEDISFGVYKPHYSFATPELYKQRLDKLRAQERQMIRDGGAAACEVEWTVGNSKRDGARMTKQYLKLILRAFNGECDAAVANVAWNNVLKMEERLRKAFEALNELGAVMQMRLSPEYLALKLAELRLTQEFEQKKYDEREELRRAREQMREEEKAQRELDRAKAEAEKDEERFAEALERARREAVAATGVQLERLTAQVASFEAKLDEARKKKERAMARAQLTKSGFVYVISNIGSFGEGICKIGMTRRIEPMERVQELGGASVPFPFDVHAMLYSDNAPDLEYALHRHFGERSLNLVNARKEFFRGIQLGEVEAFVRERGLSAQFIQIPEAREYRQTLALRLENETARPPAPALPETLFRAQAAGSL